MSKYAMGYDSGSVFRKDEVDALVFHGVTASPEPVFADRLFVGSGCEAEFLSIQCTRLSTPMPASWYSSQAAREIAGMVQSTRLDDTWDWHQALDTREPVILTTGLPAVVRLDIKWYLQLSEHLLCAAKLSELTHGRVRALFLEATTWGWYLRHQAINALVTNRFHRGFWTSDNVKPYVLGGVLNERVQPHELVEQNEAFYTSLPPHYRRLSEVFIPMEDVWKS